MSQLLPVSKGFLFSSIIFHEDHWQEDRLIDLWSERFGQGSLLKTSFNPSLPYYAKEMGEEPKLHRFIYCSEKLHPRDCFVSAKVWATDFENTHSITGARTVNIDIGLLNLENMILATGKNYSHRVYLNSGIFADLNYIFQGGTFTMLPWTYPDYQEGDKVAFFLKMRTKLLKMQKGS